MLIDDAVKLLAKDRLTIDEIAELSKIVIKLSIEQWRALELSAEQEYQYHLNKANLITKWIKTWLAYNKSEVMALNVVEKDYWEYRINKEKSKKFASICNRIDSHIKLEMHRNKLDILASDASIDI